MSTLLSILSMIALPISTFALGYSMATHKATVIIRKMKEEKKYD